MGRKIPVGNGKYLDEETGEFVFLLTDPPPPRPRPTIPSDNGYRNYSSSYNNSQTSENHSKGKIIFFIILSIIIWIVIKGCAPSASDSSQSASSNPPSASTNSPKTTGATTSVTISNTAISISQNAYANRQLVNIIIPDSVRSIGSGAFLNNKLTKINIPSSVRTIGMNAFADNPITSITIGANVTLNWLENVGILGKNTGFNGAYDNNGSKAGTYTRTNAYTMDWRYNGQLIRKPTAIATNLSVKIVNFTGNSVVAIYITSSDSWGNNRLSSNTILQTGYQISLQLSNHSPNYNMYMIDNKGNHYRKLNVVVSNNTSIRFTSNDMIAVNN